MVRNKIKTSVLPGPATCLSVCPKSNYLAIGIDTKLYIWQLCSGKLLSVQQKHYQPITCIKLSSESEYVAVGGEDGLLVVYYLADLIAIQHSLLTQSKIGQVEPIYSKHDHSMPIRDIHIGQFGSNSRLATVSSDQTCRLYSLSNGETLLTLVFGEPLTSVIFDSPCWQLYVGTNSGAIHQFNLKNPPRALTYHINKKSSEQFIGHKGKVIGIALNINNTILASGSDDNFVFTWEINSKQILQKFEHKAAVTNLKFVANFKNFFEQSFRPGIVVKSLDRALDISDDEFVVSVIQNEDIEISDDENVLEKEKSRDELTKENMKLRITNYQLYRAALEISKKYNNR
ncbi:WD repeat-containing protein 18 isoform X2 [Cylas formicarius]|uniref:WD repeat-containing protein 18 isoform X2 n=1 Tax=Cylas formicarius TaxID=197179 RepID=UPI002958D2BC|nr:WD repeat-containing protein 18 isoform X2 [Cylas formicarius]